MRTNVGGLDRIGRGVAGIWLLAVAVAAYLDDQNAKAAIGAVAGAGLLQNAWTGYCGGNHLFGVDTTRGEPGSGGR